MYDAFFKEDEEETIEEKKGKERSKLEQVIESLPTRYKKIGERLLNFIWNKGARWNDKGEVIMENEQPLTGSNIIDLLRDSIHNFKFVPNKAREFYDYCARLHLPQSLVANTARRAWLRSDEQKAPETSMDIDLSSWEKLK